VPGVHLSPSTVFLACVLLLVAAGSFLVYRLRRDVEEDSGPVTEDDVMRDLERAYLAGQMDQAEFRRVSESLRGPKPDGPRPGPPPATEPDPPAEGTPGA
jgi:hypothetical protein